MAVYASQAGDVTSGLEMAQQATVAAARAENPHEFYNREIDEAQLLLWAGKPSQALALIQRTRPGLLPGHTAHFQLLEVAAYLILEEAALAHDRLQDAL